MISLYYCKKIVITFFIGTGSVGFNIMQNFLTTHKKLKFLGLMHTLDSALDFFTDPTYPLYNPNLVVSIIYLNIYRKSS